MSDIPLRLALEDGIEGRVIGCSMSTPARALTFPLVEYNPQPAVDEIHRAMLSVVEQFTTLELERRDRLAGQAWMLTRRDCRHLLAEVLPERFGVPGECPWAIACVLPG